MRHVNEEELGFYDGVAERIDGLLGCPTCPLNQSTLALRIGWNRSSLCNFINRVDKSIAAHFIPQIASSLQVSVEYLLNGRATPSPERTRWDARCDDVQVVLDKSAELRLRKAHSICLMGILPTEALPNRAMVANFVDSICGGANQTAAERWHELIDALRESMKDAGAHDIDYVIPYADLLRLPLRRPPYEAFSDDEVVQLLDNLKMEWVRQRGLRIIAVDDSALTAEVNVELASNFSLNVVGCETQIRFRRDLRADWDDDAQAARSSRESLIRLKRAAGFGVRERPTGHQAERLVDQLLSSVEVAKPGTPMMRDKRESRMVLPDESACENYQFIAGLQTSA